MRSPDAKLPDWLSLDRDMTNVCTNSQRGMKYYRQIFLCTPPWIDDKKVREIYKLAKNEGKEVDHIVPLNSNIVCGLHCEDNLQLLTPLANGMKSNNWWPDMPDEQQDLFGIDDCEQYYLF